MPVCVTSVLFRVDRALNTIHIRVKPIEVDQKMRILYHHRIRSKDGQYVHLQELVDALRRAGHEVHISGPSAVESEPFGNDAGLVAWLKRYIPQAIYELMEIAYAVLDYVRLARDIRAFRPACIYERYNLYLPSGVWAKHRYRLPMLLEVNAPLYEERKRHDGIALDRLARWTQHYCWREADMCLAVTQVLADRIVSTGVSPSRVQVVQNAINHDFIRDAPTNECAKAALGLSQRTLLGFVGFLRSWHGLNRVVEMLKDPALEGCDLLIVGDGPARSELEAQVAQLNLQRRVHFAGIVDRDRVANYVSAFDIALQPDVVEYASPLKIYEYLALGKAIVAPSRPNIREILTDGQNALLFDPQDVNGVRQAVAKLAGSAELRERLGQAAKRTLDERDISWDTNATRVVSWFRAMTDSPVVSPT